MSKPRILIVEDKRVTAEHLRSALTGMGYEAEWIACTGEEAVSLAMDLMPDLILMDIMLAGAMDGIEAAQTIRSRVDTPVVFLSAYSNEETLRRSAAAEPFGYLLKPFRTEELKTTIETALLKHNMEKRLRQSEQRLQLALKGGALGIWEINVQTGDAIYDQRAAELFGYSLEDLEPSLEAWHSLIHPDDVESVNSNLKACLRGERPLLELEHRIRHKSGEWRWCLARGQVVEYDGDGKALRMMGTNMDVTDRKRAEISLSERIGELKGLNDMAREVNKNLGLEEFIDGCRKEIMRLISPDLVLFYLREGDRLIYQEIGSENDKPSLETPRDIAVGDCLCGLAARHGKPEYCLNIHADPLGTLDECKNLAIQSFAALPLLTENEAVGVLCIASLNERDFSREALFLEALAAHISVGLHNSRLHRKLERTAEDLVAEIDRRQLTEESLREQHAFRKAVIERVGEGLCVCHEIEDYPFVRFTVWNERMTEITGYNIETINELGWCQSMYPDLELQKRAIERMQRMRTGEDLGGEEWEVTRADGQRRVLSISSSAIEACGGQRHVLALMSDITDRKKTEDELKRYRDHLEEVVRDRTEELEAANEELHRAKSEWELTFDSVPELIAILGNDSRILRVNKALAERLGMNPEELKGLLCYELVHASSSRPPDCPHALLMADGCSHTAELVIGNLGGEFEVTVAPLRDNVGKIFGSVHVARDITERKIAEEALRQSEERYRLVTEHSMTGVFILQAGLLAYTNQRLVDMLGYPKQEVIGKPAVNFVHPDDREMVAARAEARLRGEAVPTSYEVRLVNKAGDTVWAQLLAALTQYDGKPAVMGNIADMTERKTAEAELRRSFHALRESNAEIQALLECSRALLNYDTFEDTARHIFDVARKVTGATAGYVALLSSDGSENEVLFLDSGGAECAVDPALPMPIRGLRANAYRTGQTVWENDFSNSEWMGFMPDGHVKMENVLFAPLVVGGRAVGVMGLANKNGGFGGEDARMASAFADFAAVGLEKNRAEEALRQSEEKYRLLFSQENDPIVLFDLETHSILDVNQAAQKIYGYDRQTFMGLTTLDMSAEPQATRESIQEVLELGSTKIPLRWHKKQDGTIFPVEISTGSLYLKGRKLGTAIIRDISERKSAEEARLQLERLGAIADLAAGVAHHFNNMLQVIMGGVSLSLRKSEMGDSAAVQAMLQEVIKSCRFAAETVRRLQEFVRMGKEEGDAARVIDLSATALQAVETSRNRLQGQSDKSGIRISLVTDLAEGCFAEVNESGLFEVITSLIRNAWEAMPEGGEVHIKTSVRGDQVLLQVKDSGIGIADEHLSRIFEPFFTTKGFQRVGMGLATSYGVVTRHGGTISVENDQYQGAIVKVILPLAKEAPRGPLLTEPPPLLVGLRILVIDDVEPIRSMLSELLVEFGHEVLAVASGEEGLQIFNERSIDLVICDLGMPGMNGLEVAKRIKTICEERCVTKTLFVIFTGWGDQLDEKTELEEFGIDAVIAKPLDPSTLRKIVEDLARSRLVEG